MARAAAARGTVMCLSTLATARPSEVAAAAPDARLWFQLYCFRDRGVTRALLSRSGRGGVPRRGADRGCPAPGKAGAGPAKRLPAASRDRRAERRRGDRRPTGPISVADVLGLVDPALSWADLEALVVGLEPAGAGQGRDDGRGRGAGRRSGRGRGDRLQPRRAPARRRRGHGRGGRRGGRGGWRSGRGADGRRGEAGDRRGDGACPRRPGGAGRQARGLGPGGGGGPTAPGECSELLRDELELALALCGCPAPEAVSRAHVQRA